MKKTLTHFLAFACSLFTCQLLPISLNAQQTFLWGRSGGSAETSQSNFEEEDLRDVATDPHGNVYILSPAGTLGMNIDGQSFTGFGNTNIMLASYKSDGSLRWVKLVGAGRGDYCYNLGTDGTDGVYFTALIDKSNGPLHIDTNATLPQNYQTAMLLKYDTAGNYQWSRLPQAETVPSAQANQSGTLAMDVSKSGSVYWLMLLCPGTYANGALTVLTTGTYLVKYSSSGGFSYVKPDLEINGAAGNGVSLKVDENNNCFYISGKWWSGLLKVGNDTIKDPVYNKMYVASFKLDGSLLWMKTNSSGWGSFAGRAVVDGSGNIFLVGGANAAASTSPPTPATNFNGYIVTHGNGHSTPFIVKMDKNGNNIWARDAEVNNAGGANAVALRGNEVVMAGNYISMLQWPGYPGFSSSTQYDVFVTSFDVNSGNVVGMNRITSNPGYNEYPRCMASDGKGNVYIGGSFKDVMYIDWLPKDTLRSSGGDMDWFLVKYGDMWPASVGGGIAAAAVKIYPNPVTDELTLEGAAPGTAIAICNTIGQQVFSGRVVGEKESLDLSSVSPGFYILQLTGEDGSKKVMKLQKR